MLGLIFSLATVVIAVLTGRTGFQSIGMLLVFVAVFILVFEHVLPMLIMRRNPERVLEFLLPPFDYAARFLHPLTGTLVRLLVEGRRDRERQGTQTVTAAAEEESGEAAHAYLEAGEEQGLIERDERRLLQSIVDFGDTLVREVMTPRPDIVAIRADATLASSARSSGAGASRYPGLQGEPGQHSGIVPRLDPATGAPARRRPLRASVAGGLR